jgi:PAS domain S-box-containing protein
VGGGTDDTSEAGALPAGRFGASFADALDALPVVAFVATPDGDVEYVSRGWTVLTGYTGLEAVGAGYRCAFEPDDLDRLAAIWRERPAGNATYGGEYRLRLRDGRRRWVRIEIAAVLEPADGALRAWLGTMINIDDSKRIASELREREAAYRAFAGAVPGNTWTASPAGDLTFIGHDWQEIDPNQATRALGRAWLNEVHDDDRERVRARWDDAIRTGEPYEAEFRVRVDGEQYRWLRVRAMPVRDERGVIVRWIGINLDIHDAHSADHARDMYASLVERSWNFIAISDPDGRVEYINAAGRELIGIASIDACRGNPIFDFLDAADRAAVEGDAIAALRESGRWRGDVHLRHELTGRRIPVTCVAFMLVADDGTVLGIASVCHDQREKQRIEDGLRLLARTGAAVVDSLDYQRTLDNIANAFLDDFAALCVIDVLPAGGDWERTIAHHDPAAVAILRNVSPPRGNHPVARAIDRRESSVSIVDAAWGDGLDASRDRIAATRALRIRSLICVPIVTPAGDVAGALSCALDDRSEREDYTALDLGFVDEVARRAGAAIANVREYERERRVAIELQAASLPARLPQIDGIRLDAAYRPGSKEANIGGDWYDAFLVDDGRLVMTCGDVLGHGLHAAVSMTKLRLAMQSAAMVDADPHLMLRVADATLRVSDPDAYATAVAAVYDRTTRRLSIASAGHPCPILRDGAGRVEELDVAGLMIGLRSHEPRAVTVVDVPPGASIAFYTDGLVEFGRDQRAGLERLLHALCAEGLPDCERPAESVVEAVLATDGHDDDIAVLFARFD